jgi:hypothetical protein
MARIIALAPTVPLVETMRTLIVLGCALALILAEAALPQF